MKETYKQMLDSDDDEEEHLLCEEMQNESESINVKQAAPDKLAAIEMDPEKPMIEEVDEEEEREESGDEE